MLTLATATLNRYDLLGAMIASAERGTRKPDRYFIIDNGGKLDERSLPENTTSLTPDRNLGVAASVNRIFRANSTDLTIWTNDDVEFQPNTLELMEKAALEDASRLFILPESAQGAAFTVFLARYELFERIGWFDERFFPAYFEDNDFGYRMKLAGIPRHVVPCGYRHQGSATLKAYLPNELRQHHQDFERNRDLYVVKWGGLPEYELFKEPQA